MVYRLLRLHVNFFQPVQKLVTRVRVGRRVRRVYDRAQTPYQRLCATGVLKPEAREALDRLYQSLNPLQLRRQLDAALESSRPSPPRRRPFPQNPAVSRAGAIAQRLQDRTARPDPYLGIPLRAPLTPPRGQAGNRYL